jgi:hypothetical protein
MCRSAPEVAPPRAVSVSTKHIDTAFSVRIENGPFPRRD